MKDSEKDKLLSDEVNKLAKLLQENGYNIFTIEQHSPTEKGGEIVLHCVAKVSKYLSF